VHRAEYAAALGISRNTLQTNVNRINPKLGIRPRASAAEPPSWGQVAMVRLAMGLHADGHGGDGCNRGFPDLRRQEWGRRDRRTALRGPHHREELIGHHAGLSRKYCGIPVKIALGSLVSG
jgi:hypothetical protein